MSDLYFARYNAEQLDSDFKLTNNTQLQVGFLLTAPGQFPYFGNGGVESGE